MSVDYSKYSEKKLQSMLSDTKVQEVKLHKDFEKLTKKHKDKINKLLQKRRLIQDAIVKKWEAQKNS